MTDFYRKLGPDFGTQIYKHKRDEGREPHAIRIFCEHSGTAWLLQVRGPERVRNHYDVGKNDYIANAKLSRADMLALRDAINTLLAE